MAAIFQKDSALIADEAEASRLHNKGCYGEPQSGGSLRLNLLEALYLYESERLNISGPDGREMSFGELVTYASRRMRNFEVRYIVYSDMRRRGLIVNLAGDSTDGIDFHLYRRGDTPKTAAPQAFVISISERQTFDLDFMFAVSAGAAGTGKEVILAIVDEEGDITYYRMKTVEPHARVREHFSRAYSGILLSDRVLIPSEEDAAEMRSAGFYGNQLGTGLQISMIEAAYLTRRKMLKLVSARTGRKASISVVMDMSSRLDSSFGEKMAVYEDMKNRGFIVKTGFKYGSHFRAYDADPEKAHAKFLVHAVSPGYAATWPEISRAVRLSHGVRKEILFARAAASGVTGYLELKRHIL